MTTRAKPQWKTWGDVPARYRRQTRLDIETLTAEYAIGGDWENTPNALQRWESLWMLIHSLRADELRRARKPKAPKGRGR